MSVHVYHSEGPRALTLLLVAVLVAVILIAVAVTGQRSVATDGDPNTTVSVKPIHVGPPFDRLGLRNETNE